MVTEYEAVSTADRPKELLSDCVRFPVLTDDPNTALADEVVLQFKTDRFVYRNDAGDVIEVLDSVNAEVVGVVQTVNPSDDDGAGSTINAATRGVNVGAVVNDADDWINLPPIASLGFGDTIKICCNAGTNFELRAPAASNTKINDVDADGTQEYLCTDTDVIFVTKRTTTGWVAQSITKLGAVRTAVIPD